MALAGRRPRNNARGLRKAMEAGAGGADRTEVIQSLLGIGKQALASRDYSSAISVVREYLKFNSSDASAYMDLGKAYWESGAMRDALGAFAKSLELNPRNAEALKFLQSR